MRTSTAILGLLVLGLCVLQIQGAVDAQDVLAVAPTAALVDGSAELSAKALLDADAGVEQSNESSVRQARQFGFFPRPFPFYGPGFGGFYGPGFGRRVIVRRRFHPYGGYGFYG